MPYVKLRSCMANIWLLSELLIIACPKNIFSRNPLDKPIIDGRMIEEQVKTCWLCRAEKPVKTVVDVLGNVFYNRS
jgi:hypothetical protein